MVDQEQSAADPRIIELRKTRSMIKGQLTRFKRFLDEPYDLSDLVEMETRLKRIESRFDEFDNIQSRLESLDEAESAEREEIENTFYQSISLAKSRLVQSSQSNLIHNTGTVTPITPTNNQDSLLDLKLPNIKLPSFSGKIEDWQSFYEAFMQLIDDRQDLSDMKKLYFLKSCLSDHAYRLVQTYKTSNENYQVVLGLLQRHFANKRVTINKHINAILDLPHVQRESAISLRKLTDAVYLNVSSLKNLGVPVGHWDLIIINLVTNKLDENTKSEWEDTIDDESDLPTYEQMLKFLNRKCFKLENMQSHRKSSAGNSNKVHQPQGFQSRPAGNRIQNLAVTEKIPSPRIDSGRTDSFRSCFHCRKSHYIYACPDFLKLSPNERYDIIKTQRLCLNCLTPGHTRGECRRTGRCKYCNSNHNSLLHKDNSQQGSSITPCTTNLRQSDNSNVSMIVPGSNSHNKSCNMNIYPNMGRTQGQESPDDESAGTQVLQNQVTPDISIDKGREERSLVLLGTAQVLIFDNAGYPHKARAILDSGSQTNIISQSLCNKLHLNEEEFNISIAGINKKITNVSKRTKAVIRSRLNSFSVNLSFLVLPVITDKLPGVSFSNKNILYPENINLADPDFNISQNVDLLLGADIFYEILGPNQHTLGQNMPRMQETIFGWIFTGTINLPISRKNKINSSTVCNYNDAIMCNFIQDETVISNTDLNDSLTKFWTIEEIPADTRYLSPEAKFCEEYFKKTTTRDLEGRFVVRLPFLQQTADFGDSLSVALRRFKSLENKFQKNPSLQAEYIKFMKEYEDLGHMTRIPFFNLRERIEQPYYVLPHQAVIKQTSSTTKCRVVFDASARTNLGTSLNDNLNIGYTVQDDLFSIVTRLRLYKYVLSADIKMMFRQIKIHPDDRKFQLILWRADQSDQIQLYTLNTVTYGTGSAPFLATRVLQQLASDFENEFPRTCAVMKNSFYMDDFLISVGSKDEALQIHQELSHILGSAGFELRKWSSNDDEILNDILNGKDNSEKLIEIKDSKELKTLGISWVSSTDTLNYSVNINLQGSSVTKRIILSTISRIFDPLGLIGPAIIRAKLLIQSLWSLKVEWDEVLPQSIFSLWKEFVEQMQAINDVNVPRQVLSSEFESIELHGFSDASEKAYGCCIYLVSVDSNNSRYSNLLCAKSKVAPKQKHTLPRLELLAATLLARLVHSVKQILTLRFSRIVYHTDSTIVLSWLRLDPSQLKLFVANRVSKITSLSEITQWRHVSSKENAADLISRGIEPSELKDLALWWHGPEFLILEQVESNESQEYDSIELPEIKKSVSLILTNQEGNFDFIQRYSSLTRAQRVLAYCYRFIKAARGEKKIESLNLTSDELEFSLFKLIKIAQNEEFAHESQSLKKSKNLKFNSKILCLNPFVDKDGLLRVGGRLRHSNVEFSQKHPIILPKRHRLTNLIIEHEHKKNLHAGAQNLLAYLRLKYWPIDGKCTVKGVIRSCMKCFRVNPKPVKFLMGDLPEVRVIPSRPFSRCAIDYAGPIWIKDRSLRNAKLVKTYIAIFVCFSTRAVHIELANDLTTDCFLNVLKRFISRRGKPNMIFSDQGSNFIGSHNHFAELQQLINDTKLHEKILNFLSTEKIEWVFIPSKSPHVGGLWEAAVKSAKFHLKRVLANVSVTYEEMYTVLTQIEACLNSRPLSSISSDPNDYLPLTPAHFIIGDSLMAAPQIDVRDQQFSRLSRYHRMQQLVQHFWSRWSREYLTELQKRSKWKSKVSTNLSVGDLVILKEDNLPPLRWPLARILEVHPGLDNVTRIVTVKTASGSVFKRSVAKICVLPIDSQV